MTSKRDLTVLCVIIAYLCCTGQVAAELYCPSPWIEVANVCFRISDTKAKYDQAAAYCQNMGGSVATFTQEQFDGFKAHIGSGDYWIGLTCTTNCDDHSNWEWVDGTETGTWVDSNWVYGEPDLGETYARVTDTKKFAGLYSSFDIGYICKKGVASTTIPTLPPTPRISSTTTGITTRFTTTLTTSTDSTGTTAMVERPAHPPTNPPTTPTDPPGLPYSTDMIERTTTTRTTPTIRTSPPSTPGTSTTEADDDEQGENDGHHGAKWASHDNHVGIWVGMSILAVVGVIALGLGIYLYTRSKHARVGKTPNVLYAVDSGRPQSPPPAYDNWMQPTAPSVTSIAPMATSMPAPGTHPGADMIKVHP